MKKIALILAAVAILGLAVMLWQTAHQELVVTGQGLNQLEQSEQEKSVWIHALENGSFVGFVYDEQIPADSESTRVTAYTLRLRNTGLLPAEMVEMQLVSAAGDIASYQEPAAVSIEPGREATITLRLLSSGKSSLRRDLIVTYYLWGRLHSIRYTLS